MKPLTDRFKATNLFLQVGESLFQFRLLRNLLLKFAKDLFLKPSVIFTHYTWSIA